MRRALQRLLDEDLEYAMALGFCQVGGYNEFVSWQSGDSKLNYKGFPMETPRWPIVGLTHDGIKLAVQLEQPVAGQAGQPTARLIPIVGSEPVG